MNAEKLSEENLEKKEPKTVEELLLEHHQNKEQEKIIDVSLMKFEGLKPSETVGNLTRSIETEGKESIAAQIDCYNPSKAFRLGEKNIAAFRVESRNLESDSRVEFFELGEDSTCKLIKNAPVLESYQDPFYSGEIQGQKILGAVKIREEENRIFYKTDFFCFKDDLNEITHFAEGPEMMKDIRLIELPGGKIGVFLRPQGGENEKYGRGKIGYMEVENLASLEDNLKNFEDKAKIFDNLFASGEWGGVNDLHYLKNGDIGIIGHVAHCAKNEIGQETNLREYYAAAAVFNTQTREISNLKIIMTEEEAENRLGINVEQKNPSLKSVYYPGGAERMNDGTMISYAGIGDTHAIISKIKDPFLEIENKKGHVE